MTKDSGAAKRTLTRNVKSRCICKVEQEKASQEEVVALLRQWEWMNVVRGFLATAGGLTSVWAIVEGQR